MAKFKLRFCCDEVPAIAARYSYTADVTAIDTLAQGARSKGFLTKAELLIVGQWKSARAVPKIAQNVEGLIIDVTRLTLSTPHERMRIGALNLLHGVGHPMASVVLHWFHPERYPIIDFRALWSLGIEKPPTFYSFDFWWSYVAFCRQLATDAGVDMRTLDRALWQYSKENQTPSHDAMDTQHPT
jgi:hypothetical protein